MMSELEATTTAAKDDIAVSLKCLVCNHEMVQGEFAYCLFTEVLNESGQTALSEVLSTILSVQLIEDDVASKVVCEDCNNRITKYQELENQMLEIKFKMIQDFDETTRMTECDEELTVEEEFDIAIVDSLQQSEDAANTIVLTDHPALDLKPIQNIEESSSADLVALLSGNQKEIIITDASFEKVTAPNVSIKQEHAESSLEEDDEFFDQSTGNMVEISTENDDYDQLIEPSSASKRKQETDRLGYVFFNNGKFSCTLCTAESLESQCDFDDAIMIADHLKSIHDLDTHVCKLCGDDFSTKDDMNRHRERKHSGTQKSVKNIEEGGNDRKSYYAFNGEHFMCLMCPQDIEETPTKFDARTISAHYKTSHNLRIYVCDICGVDFRKRTELTEHVDEAHGGTEDGEFACETCSRIFTNLRQFRIHKRLHYTSNKSYQCSQCDKRYSSKNLLDEHMNMHTGLRPYKCQNCSKDFASKYTLTAHMKIHSNRPRPYSCKSCSKAFFSAQNLYQHEKIHSGVKEYICEVCDKAFGTQHNLEVHKVVHTGYKPFICRTCGKAFARRAEIKDHERTHTGERPFVCDICHMSFAQRSNLTTHKRVTHLNEKRYKCEECDRTFKRRRLLDYHVRSTHTGERPYVCLLCNATFVYPEHYKKHLRIHSGVKPYACEVCGKTFNSRDNRNAHRFIHSDKKPYECLVCGQGFMRKPLLYSHMQQSGHLNDTIIINQPQIMNESDEKKSTLGDDNILIEMMVQDDDELVEEHLIDGSSQNEMSVITGDDPDDNIDVNDEDDDDDDDDVDDDDSMHDEIIKDEILDDDLSHAIDTEQFVVRYEGESEPLQLMQIRGKYESGKDSIAWVNLMAEKNS